MLRSKVFIGVMLCMIMVSSCNPINSDYKVQKEKAVVGEKPVVIAFAHKSVNSYCYTIMNEAI
ncbi:MAG: hypothetical protein K0S30_993, partial [Clostridia bacterium]|nr:hypothetical protein [Clostridia bacterium]